MCSVVSGRLLKLKRDLLSSQHEACLDDDVALVGGHAVLVSGQLILLCAWREQHKVHGVSKVNHLHNRQLACQQAWMEIPTSGSEPIPYAIALEPATDSRGTETQGHDSHPLASASPSETS